MKVDPNQLLTRANTICRLRYGKEEGIVSRQVKALAEAVADEMTEQLQELESELMRKILDLDL